MRGVGYATIEIILLLLAAAIIGFLIAWILRRFLYNVDLGEYEERVRTAQARRRAVEQELAEAREQREVADEEITVIQARLADMESEATALTADLNTARNAVTAKDGRIEQLESEMTGLEADLATAETTVGRHEETIDRLESELAAADSLHAEIDRRGARIAELEVLVVERETSEASAERIGQLEQELAEANQRIHDLETGIASDVAADTSDEADDADDEDVPDDLEPTDGAESVAPADIPSDAESSQPDVAVAPPAKDDAVAQMAEIAARTAGDGDVVEDDLKKIHGVGPKLEQLLKSLGITSFRQVARFEPADIAVVTAALDAFPGRIERDDWMSSAAEQHEAKYGETP